MALSKRVWRAEQQSLSGRPSAPSTLSLGQSLMPCGAGASGGGHLKPEVPPGAEGEIRRVLSVTTWYEVLDVAPGADAAVIKRAKHAKALLTHPDKAKGAVGAHEAAQRVNLVCASGES